MKVIGGIAMTELVTHYWPVQFGGPNTPLACKTPRLRGRTRLVTEDKARVTCKRCLVALDKRFRK